MKKYIWIILLMASSAFGLQKMQVQEGVMLNVAISKSKLNEISIQGKRIASIKSKSKQYKMIQDDQQGKLYLQPLNNNPFRVFIISETGKSYPLKFIPTKMEAQTVVLVPEGKKKAVWEKKASYNSLIAKLLVGLYKGKPVPGFEVGVGKKRIPSIKGTKAYHKFSLVGEHVSGLTFHLKNTSKATLSLKETHFFTPGVLAISIETPQLQPGASTRVFIFKEVI